MVAIKLIKIPYSSNISSDISSEEKTRALESFQELNGKIQFFFDEQIKKVNQTKLSDKSVFHFSTPNLIFSFIDKWVTRVKIKFCETIPEMSNFTGINSAFDRFTDTLYNILKHLSDTNTLSQTSFRALIKPANNFLMMISSLKGFEDIQDFFFPTPDNDINQLQISKSEIKFKDKELQSKLLASVKDARQVQSGCPAKNMRLKIDFHEEGVIETNLIKALYYLCARQVEMALFGRKTDTPA